MIEKITLKLTPLEAADEDFVLRACAKKCRVTPEGIQAVVKLRRSIDARHHPPKINLQVAVYIGEVPKKEPTAFTRYQKPVGNKRVIIVGAGPAGYFAALELIEKGVKPVIFDRGKDVQTRRRDLRQIQHFGIVNPHSNYCFGEGGAGAYSDGKLYTRSHKRGNIQKVLNILVEHGANPNILVDAHPHIGSNKLPKVLKNIRETIRKFGGEIHFNAHVTDLLISEGTMSGVIVNGQTEHLSEAVILATGHSARDIFYLLQRRNIRLAAKPFAMGVRIEHPQPLIDQIQYGASHHDLSLPAASYRLACQVGKRGVFSFCMCPGGWIVPSSTTPGELVINGMSLSKRDNEFANSGIVVSVELEDLESYREHGVLAGLAYQQAVEKIAFEAGGDKTQRAPAQRMDDFVKRKLSAEVGPTSYIPGIHSSPLHNLLPKKIVKALTSAFMQFGKMMKGYYTNEAQLLAVESRTSSPVRIPRDKESLMHVEVENLYPCGEGAGYAGGIISAALDGQNVARAITARH